MTRYKVETLGLPYCATAFLYCREPRPVTIMMTVGARFSERIDHRRGHSLRGSVTWPDLKEKWGESLSGYDVEQALAIGQNLEELEDVGELAAIFSSR